MISKLPYAKQGYSGGKKLFDNTVGRWQKLKLNSTIKGEVSFLAEDGLIYLKGHIDNGGRNLKLFTFPSELGIVSCSDKNTLGNVDIEYPGMYDSLHKGGAMGAILRFQDNNGGYQVGHNVIFGLKDNALYINVYDASYPIYPNFMTFSYTKS